MVKIDYEQALAYLYKSYAKGAKQGVASVLAVLAQLGAPQERLAVVHVAGTNGKGSTCAYLNHILLSGGYHVGVFTSPHLMRYNERFVVDGIPITDDDFAAAMTDVRQAAESIGVMQMSFFEILTVMSFHYFAKREVDYVIIEAGIGGRLDSTNVITRPLLSVITAIGYDHMEILGDTLAQIAWEKAGIIKPGCPVAVYPTPLMPVFEAEARSKNAPLYRADDLTLFDLSYDLESTTFSVSSAYFAYQGLQIGLLGEQQVHNAAHALLCVHALREAGVVIPDDCVRDGLRRAEWPGRFELVADSQGKGTAIVLDGAHNDDGAAYFRKAMDLYFPDAYIVLVVGVLRNKDYGRILAHITGRADLIICTQPVSYKGLAAETLAAHLQTQTVPCSVAVIPDYQAAFRHALDAAHAVDAGRPTVVAVTGSLYLIGDVKQYLRETGFLHD